MAAVIPVLTGAPLGVPGQDRLIVVAPGMTPRIWTSAVFGEFCPPPTMFAMAELPNNCAGLSPIAPGVLQLRVTCFTSPKFSVIAVGSMPFLGAATVMGADTPVGVGAPLGPGQIRFSGVVPGM